VIDSPLEAERVLIESNRQREKTTSEVMHEAEAIARIIEEENKRAILVGASAGGKTAGRGRPKTDDSPCPTLDKGYAPQRRTDAAVAEAVGMKRSTHRKVKAVYDAAKDDTLPAPIRAVAQQQMSALDTGDTTPNAAEQAVKKATVAETMRTLPPGAPDPFADMPKVRAARLVKNARQALSATGRVTGPGSCCGPGRTPAG